MVTHRRSPNHLSLLLLLTCSIARSSLSFVAAAEEENAKNAPSPAPARFRGNTGGIKTRNHDEYKVRGPAPVLSLDSVNDVIGGGDDAASDDSSGDNGGNKKPTAKDNDDDNDNPKKTTKKSYEDLVRPFSPEERQKIADDIVTTDTELFSEVEFWEEVKRLEEMGKPAADVTEWVIRRKYDADYAAIEAQMEKKKPIAAVEEDDVVAVILLLLRVLLRSRRGRLMWSLVRRKIRLSP